MKCPRCKLIVNDIVPKCKGCGFSISDLGRKIKQKLNRSGYVNDFAEILSADDRQKIETRLSEFHQKTGGEIVIVTIKSSKPIKPSEYIFWLFNQWQIGGDDHSGLMLLLSISERRIESEVGYSWEHIISDAESGTILNEYVVPLLKEGKFAEALLNGSEKLASIIYEAYKLSLEDKSESKEV